MYIVKLSQYGPALIVLCLLCQPAQALDFIFDNDESELTEEMSAPTETQPDMVEIATPNAPPDNQNDTPPTLTPTTQSKISKASNRRQRAQWIKNNRTTLYWDGNQWQTTKP